MLRAPKDLGTQLRTIRRTLPFFPLRVTLRFSTTPAFIAVATRSSSVSRIC